MKVETISQGQLEYPPALTRWMGKDAPSQLSYIGNIQILKRPLLGLFSSVKCPASLILKAHNLAQALTENGTPVIGGFHSPVEKEMLSVLMRGKGPLVICPARGLGEMRFSSGIRQDLEEGRLLILSAYAGEVKRINKSQALDRNLLVAALADTITIISLSPGGTIDALCRRLVDWGKPISYAK